MDHLNEESERLCRRMDRLRDELSTEVADVVDSAEQMTDWREWVRKYPWICVGAAAVVGYLVVPQRAKVVIKANELDSRQLGDVERDGKSSSLFGNMFNFAKHLAMRSATTYVTRRLQSFVDQNGQSRFSSNGSDGDGDR